MKPRTRGLLAIAAGTAVALALILVTTLTRAGGPAPQDTPGYGSAVVPAAQIRAQVRAILPYYRIGERDYASPLYGMEKALAAKFGNVSNADSPLALSRAEVDFELAVDNAPRLDRDHPWIDDGVVHELAAACGITETAAGIGP